MKFCVVITTIQPPTPSVITLHETLSKNPGAELIVVGDRKGPNTYPSWATFLPIESPIYSDFSLAKHLPEKHYARKNLGYLYAFSKGAPCIYETDDDNHPLDNWTSTRSPNLEAIGVQGSKWSNIYLHFTKEIVWPRGLALDHIRVPGETIPAKVIFSPIQQGLADGAPDVDAIWRLIYTDVIRFERNSKAFYLVPGTWCPFNSQNTWWFPEAFPLMYLPSHVSFRMTDIWRSFVAQRCLWEMGAVLSFHVADVWQDRNEHNIMKDFNDEVSGYTSNNRIAETLAAVNLKKGSDHVYENLFLCYESLVANKIMISNELQLLNSWITDCKKALNPLANKQLP